MPIRPPVQGPDGALYGTTSSGGAWNFGTLYRCTLQGQLTTLIHFTGLKEPYFGTQPNCALVALTDGTLYGTTSAGGTHDQGTIYRVKPTSEMLAGSTPAGAPPPQGSSMDAFMHGANAAAVPDVAPVPTPAPAAPPAADSGSHTPEVINTFKSPDGAYSISMVNKPWLSPDQRPGFNNYHMLVLSKDGTEIAAVPTWREMTDAYWSPDGKYLAVNNVRSDMGGDQLWILALPGGQIIKAPDDATSKKWVRTGREALDQNYPEPEDKGSGKAFLSLFATGWQGDLLKFTVGREDNYENLQGFFDFNGLADPKAVPAITSSSFAMHGDGSLTATNVRDLTLKSKPAPLQPNRPPDKDRMKQIQTAEKKTQPSS